MNKFFRLCFLLLLCQGSLHAFDLKEFKKGSLKTLQESIEKVIKQADPTAQVGIKILSLNTGKILYERRADERFIPGSLLKVITAAAALHTLGPSYTFDTKLYVTGDVEKGVLKGDLILEGSGDPSLMQSHLEELMFDLKLHNIKEIEGDIVFDASEFDDLPLAPGWMWDEKLCFRDSPVDALILNHSCVNIWVRPAQLMTMAPYVTVYPEIPGIVIENYASMTSSDPKKTTISVATQNVINKDIIKIEGAMSTKSSPMSFKIPVKNPQLYAATEFVEFLKKNSIKFFGKVRFAKKSEQARQIATHASGSLFEMGMHMLKNNDNLYANCFFKKMGRTVFGKPGTWPNGSQAVREFLNGIDDTLFSNAVILDGSGESNYNLLTPHQVVTFLKWIDKSSSFGPEIISSLPLAGVDGALKKRFSSKALKTKLRAQAGSLKGASSLCGYVYTKNEEKLAFAILINGFLKEAKDIKAEIEDPICDLLSQFSREE